MIRMPYEPEFLRKDLKRPGRILRCTLQKAAGDHITRGMGAADGAVSRKEGKRICLPADGTEVFETPP